MSVDFGGWEALERPGPDAVRVGDVEVRRGSRVRLAGKGDKDVYLVHRRLGEPCPRCGDPLRQVDYEEHTVFYCAPCQTGGRVLKDRRMSRLLR